MEYTLSAHCKISEIREEEYKKKKQFVFRITWPTAAEEEEEDFDYEDDEANGLARTMDSPKASGGGITLSPSHSLDAGDAPGPGDDSSTPYAGMRKSKSAITVTGTKSVPSSGGKLTSQTEKVASKPVKKATWWGGFFGGGNAHTDQGCNNSPLDLACDSRTDAANWIEAIQDSLKLSSATVGGDFHVASMQSSRRAAPPGVRIKEVEEWLKSSRWKVCSILQGVRIFEQAGFDETAVRAHAGSVAVDPAHVLTDTLPNYQHDPNPYSEIPCYRVNIGVNSCTLEVFKSIMSLPPGCRAGAIKQMRVIESIDNHTDIVHILLDPIYIYPTWTAPRDLCLMRYWKHLADKSYIICFDSTFHQDCPLTTGYVRADMHATYLISPPKGADYDEEQEECLLTYIAQMDPRGWVWRSFGFQHTMLQIFMLHVLDIRDSLDMDRFVKVHFDASHERRQMRASLSAMTLNAMSEKGMSNLGSIPPPALPAHMWAEPDLQTFRLRSKTYNQDKQKVLSEPSLFKLVAVDIFEVPEPTRNIASNPKNRVAQAFARGETTWCFVMNIMVPGPPHLCFVVYLEGDRKKIEEDTPFGRIARPFFFGHDDEFRNNRFKLIPRVRPPSVGIRVRVKPPFRINRPCV